MESYILFETAAGHCGIAWNDSGVRHFRLPTADVHVLERHLGRRLPGAVRARPPPHIEAIIGAVKRYFEGETIDFSTVVVDLADQDEFFRRIYEATRRVGWGSTTTYGSLAKALGVGPEAARDVGQAMARNPVPLIIPCHRVLAAGGKLGGFSAPGGTASKSRMLELEGFRADGGDTPQRSLGF